MIINVSLAVSLSSIWEEKLRRLVSARDQGPDILKERTARAVVALVLYEAEIQEVFLSLHPENVSGSEQHHQSECIHQWSLDPSLVTIIGWEDGTSLTVPPKN